MENMKITILVDRKSKERKEELNYFAKALTNCIKGSGCAFTQKLMYKFYFRSLTQSERFRLFDSLARALDINYEDATDATVKYFQNPSDFKCQKKRR